MSARQRQIIEIETLHELLPELNYYQLLQLDPATDQAAIDQAYRAEARRLHPDRFAGLGGPVRAQVTAIYRAVTEAKRVLGNPDTRTAYDDELASGANRLSAEGSKEAKAKAAAANNPELAARTEKGGKYWRLALTDWAGKNYKGAVMNINFALTFEQDNETFKEWLAKAKKAQKDNQNPDGSNPYKLRIV